MEDDIKVEQKADVGSDFSITVQPPTTEAAQVVQNRVTDNYKDYNLVGVVGTGAFAKVWFAEFKDHSGQLQNYAVKIIELESTDSATIEQTQKEVALMGSLSHENVVACLASFVVGSELWLVMPLLRGGSCAAIMRSHPEFKNGFKDEHLLATILKDVINGLQYFHKDSRIHRDIKAGNILLSETGVAKLSDFGVSATLLESGFKRTGRRTFTGTPCWMAPEVMESKGHNHKADIWSLGITAMELAFGKPPYADQRPMKVMLMVIQNDPPSKNSYSNEDKKQDTLGRDFHKFVKQMLKKNPAKRPKAKDLLKDHYLKKAKGHEYVMKRVILSGPPTKIKPEKWELTKSMSLFPENSDNRGRSFGSWNFSDHLSNSARMLTIEEVEATNLNDAEDEVAATPAIRSELLGPVSLPDEEEVPVPSLD